MVLEGFCRSKLQDSVQLQTVLTLYDQENIRNQEQPSYSRLTKSVRRHIDQTMRTRNFRARDEIVERGAVTMSQKGKNASAERKVGECFQEKASGQSAKEDSCSFSHGSNREKKARSSSPAPIARTQTDGREPSKGFGLRGESSSGLKGQKACRNFP